MNRSKKPFSGNTKTLYVCCDVTENLYSRVISPLLKFSQIRDGWMKIGIVSSINIMHLHFRFVYMEVSG